MKTKYAFVFIIGFVQNMMAQTPSWEWARSGAGNEYDEASTVAADVSGGVVVAGYFASDDITFGTVNLINNTIGFDDMYIAKYDEGGNLLWAKRAGGSDDDKATDVATDAAGNIYLTGYFYSPTITFGSFVLDNTGVGDIFLVKYDNSGNVLWALSEGGPSLEIPYSIALDLSGNIVLAGRFSSTTLTFGTTTLNQAGSMDIFIVKYDNAGNVNWAKGIGGGSNDEAYAVCADVDNNIYVAGYFNQTVSFGSSTFTSEGQADVFLVKLNAAGDFLWARAAGGSPDDRAESVTTDASGNSYMTGHFVSPTITFGSLTLTSTGDENSFITKYDADGNALWAKGINGDSRAKSIAVKGDRLYAGGAFAEEPLNFGTSSLFLNGSRDFFLVSCDTAGNGMWAAKETANGPSSELLNAVAITESGEVYIAGLFGSDTIVFGPTVLINTDNGFESFVARLGSMSTGIDQVASEETLSFFPNPSSGSVTLQSAYEIDGVEIYGLTGEMVFYESGIHTRREPYTLDLSRLENGMYFLRAHVGGVQQVNKLLISKIPD